VRAIVTDRKGREEKLTYAAGQINVNTNKVFASTLTPNVNVLVQFWDVSSEMYNVGAKRSRPIIVVGTRDVMPPSLFVSWLVLLNIESKGSLSLSLTPDGMGARSVLICIDVIR
jgi:hypothetical protein